MSSHSIQAGDTLSAVARRYGTTVSELQRLNGIVNPDFIQVGQVLLLPASSVEALTDARPFPESAPVAVAAGRSAAGPESTATPANPKYECALPKPDSDVSRLGGNENIDVIYFEGDNNWTKKGLFGSGDASFGFGAVRLDDAGNFGDSLFGGSFKGGLLNVNSSVDGGIVHGGGSKGKFEADALNLGGSLFVGETNNPYYETGAELKLHTTTVEWDGLIGSDGKRFGFAYKAEASAEVVSFNAFDEKNIKIPFTDWTISARSKFEPSVLTAKAKMSGHIYKDLETERFHLGSAVGLGLGFLGLEMGLDLSIGPPYESRERPAGP
jgi:murein DD-endopeptidase MepM/ murein hydrolase activator NlpD